MMNEIFHESERLVRALLAIVEPSAIDSERARIADTACSLSIEHWHAVRGLLELELLPSALVVHRAQFESLVRCVWLTWSAREEDLAKLTATLDLESEQAAKNMPTVALMMQAIQEKAPPAAYAALNLFKEHNWKALNSYTHAGIHPLRRHADGYPTALTHDVLRNTNGVGVMSCMQAVVLNRKQPLQKDILTIAARHPICIPPMTRP